jgi:hypothetical protein
MYLELNLSDEGARLAQHALDTFRRLGMRYEAAKAVTKLALAAARAGDAEGALSLFGKARKLFLREHNQAWTAIIDLYQALVFYQKDQLLDARMLCERALEFLRTSPLRGKSALCQLLLARIRLAAGEAEEARRICLAALPAVGRTESPVLHHQAWFVLGSIDEACGLLDAAYEE